jgi:hypothetical protein
MLGLCSDELRLPMCAIGEANKQKLRAALEACEYTRQPVGAR